MAYLKLKVHYLSYYLIETNEGELIIKLVMANFKDLADRGAKIEVVKEVKWFGGWRTERLYFTDNGNTKVYSLDGQLAVLPEQIEEMLAFYNEKIVSVIELKEKIKEMKKQRKRSGVILTDQDKFIYKRALKTLEKNLRDVKKELRDVVKEEFV